MEPEANNGVERTELVQQIKEDVERLNEVFFLGSTSSGPEAFRIDGLPLTLQPIIHTFNSNIQALLSAAQIPYTLTFNAERQGALDRHLAKKRILAIDPYDVIKEVDDPSYKGSDAYIKSKKEADARAIAVATETFLQENPIEQLNLNLCFQALRILKSYLNDELICMASKELMRQSIVLMWVALEALATDLFVLALNSRAELAVAIFRDEHCRKRFQSRDMVRIVEEHGFELSTRMGDVMKSLGNLDDVATIKAVFQVICPSRESLRSTLAQPELWKLYQRRNLLVHRAGLIDEHFLEKTGEKFDIGSKLTAGSKEISRYVEFVRGVGRELAVGVGDVLR